MSGSSELRVTWFGCPMIRDFKWVGCQVIWDSNDFACQLIRESHDSVVNRCAIQKIWLSKDLRFKWFGCQLIWDAGDLDVTWFEMSKMKLWTLKLKNEAFLRDFLQNWKFEPQNWSFSARLPSKLKVWTSKLKLFCETSFKIKVLKIKNEAFLRDFLQN